MALIKSAPVPESKIKIDLAGPDGNAFVLMAIARKLGVQIGLTMDEIELIIEEMTSEDYNHLLETFDSKFGSYVIMYNSPI